MLSAAALGFDSVSRIPLIQRGSNIPSAAHKHSFPPERPQQFFGATEVIVVWRSELFG